LFCFYSLYFLLSYTANNSSAEIADSINYPYLRMFSVANNPSLTPLDYLHSMEPSFNWTVSGPKAFAQKPWNVFSAVCYFTGRDVYKTLGGKVPIGLLATDYSGTRAEAWTPAADIPKCPGTKAGVEEESEAKELLLAAPGSDDTITAPVNPNTFSVLWNGMVHPFLRMRFKLVVWYQGEANRSNPVNYECRFPALIRSWREQFNLPLPWFFVQLAGYNQGGLPWVQEQLAQLAALSLPQVHFATAMDLGDPLSPQNGEHPRFKQPVGDRLHRAIAANVYGRSDIVWQGPQMNGVRIASPSTDPSTVLVQLADGVTANKLSFAGTTNCGVNTTRTDTCCKLFPFWANTAAGMTLRPARATLEDASVIVNFAGLSSGDRIVQVSYAYDPTGFPQCALYNADGLPMTLFNVTLNSHINDGPLSQRHGRSHRLIQPTRISVE
jgi:hypothetical protein